MYLGKAFRLNRSRKYAAGTVPACSPFGVGAPAFATPGECFQEIRPAGRIGQ
jgi:hypothetical protein